MVRFQVKRQSELGLTLIEVLIALAILSIALTAVIKSTSQHIKNTIYLQNRMIATWVGTYVINSIRIGVIKIPNAPDQLSEENQTLGQNFTWEAMLDSTPNPRIKRISVDVYNPLDQHKLAHLESYLYAPP